jgi:hypothetical protein
MLKGVLSKGSIKERDIRRFIQRAGEHSLPKQVLLPAL